MKGSRIFRIPVIIPAVIIIVVLIIIAFSSITSEPNQIFVENKTITAPAPTEPLPTPQTPTSTPGIIAQEPTNACENCHMKGKPGVPAAESVHENMSRYCLYCHTIDHDTHPMSGDGVPCNGCHGEEQTVPSIEENATNCGKCHNYPDPLRTSNGNIVTIHRPRNISCVECHGNNVMDIHLYGKNVNIEEMLKLLNRT